MLAELNLPPLQDRRKANRLTFLYKVVEVLVPAMQSHDYLTPIQGKRLIKPKEYTDCVTSNIIDKQSTNNSKCLRLYSVPLKFTNIHFSPGLSLTGTIWTVILCALIQLTASGGPSIIGTNYSSQLSPVASTLKGPATYRFRFRSNSDSE